MYFILIVYRRTTTVVWGGGNRSINRGAKGAIAGRGSFSLSPSRFKGKGK